MSTNETMTPTPGMAATYAIGSDEYPMTVARVSKAGTTLWAQRASVRVKGGSTLFVVEPDAKEEKFTLRGDGAWRPRGSKCGRLYLGERRSYMDPSF